MVADRNHHLLLMLMLLLFMPGLPELQQCDGCLCLELNRCAQLSDQFFDNQANKLSLKHSLHNLEFITQSSQIWEWGVPCLEESALLLQNLGALLY